MYALFFVHTCIYIYIHIFYIYNTRIWWEDLREGDHLKDPHVNGRIILKRIFKKWDGGMDWIDLAQYRDRLLALVNKVINI
jgi:hypothetical protein